MSNHIQETIDWNIIRGNTPQTLDWELEIRMLKEELKELEDAEDDVDRFDALLDLKFVLLGTLGKMGLTADQISRGYAAVLEANNTKTEFLSRMSHDLRTPMNAIIGLSESLIASRLFFTKSVCIKSS